MFYYPNFYDIFEFIFYLFITVSFGVFIKFYETNFFYAVLKVLSE